MKVAEQLNDLRGQTAEDLLRRAGELEEQVFRLRLQSSMGQGEPLRAADT
jgi:ribosomal protein L29